MEKLRKMYLIRTAERFIRHMYHLDLMKTPMHMSGGSEHIAVGVLDAVGTERAAVFCSYRSHAPYLAQTDDVEGFFHEIHGNEQGPNGGRAGSMHISNSGLGHYLSSGIVADQIPVAVGAAFAMRRLKEERVSVVFFGDGATNEGVFWESLNLACMFRLPIIFVCEDNGLAVHTSSNYTQHYELWKVATAFPRLSYHHTCSRYANDISEDAVRAVHSALSGYPAMIHATYTRMYEHVGVGDDRALPYRNPSDLDGDPENDPIYAYERFLVEKGYTGDAIQDVYDSVYRRVRGAYEHAVDVARERQS